MAALIDSRTARVVRSIGLAALATVLVVVWMLPATSIIVQLALGALLVCVIATTVVAFVRALNRTRQVPGFFWRQHGLNAAGSLAQLVVAGACLVMMWMFPVASIAARVVTSSVLVLLVLASASWTVLITEWIWDRGRPTRRFDEEGHWRDHPVVEMCDQDGSRAAFPDAESARDWLDVMRPGDTVTFLCRDGGQLHVVGPSSGPFSVRCTSGDGSILADVPALGNDTVRNAVLQYLGGDALACVRLMTSNTGGPASPSGLEVSE
jgi:hypothetical protein